MIRTKNGTRVRLIRHEPGSHYVRCRRLEDAKEFDWRIDELRGNEPDEIRRTIERLDSEFRPLSDEEKGCA